MTRDFQIAIFWYIGKKKHKNNQKCAARQFSASTKITLVIFIGLNQNYYKLTAFQI